MRKMKFSPAVRLCALSLTFLIGLSEAGRYFPSEALAADAPISGWNAILKHPAQLAVPSEFASVDHFHESSSSAPLLIHIQDAHANISGQENIAKLLDSLFTRYGVVPVLVEGGTRDDSLTHLKKEASASAWKKAARKFLLEGKIAGEEFLNLTSAHPMKILGVEDEALYDQGLKAYAELVAVRPEALGRVRRLRAAAAMAKRSVYSKDLLALDAACAGNASLADCAKRIAVEAGAGYPALSAFSKAMRYEAVVDFEAARLEQAALFEKIGSTLSESEKRGLFAEAARGRDFSARAGAFSVFVEAVTRSGADLGAYPALKSYRDYLESLDAVDGEALIAEIQAAVEKRFQGAGAAVASLRSVDNRLALLEKAQEIRLSSAEFSALSDPQRSISEAGLEAYLNRELAERGSFRDLLPSSGRLAESEPKLRAFYGNAAARDEAFVRNAEKWMKAENSKVAILIAGGYHTEGLTKKFREKGWSYAVVTPRITSETIQEKYEHILLEPLGKKTSPSISREADPARSGIVAAKIAEDIAGFRRAELLEAAHGFDGARLAGQEFDGLRFVKALKKDRGRVTVALMERDVPAGGGKTVVQKLVQKTARSVDMSDAIRLENESRAYQALASLPEPLSRYFPKWIGFRSERLFIEYISAPLLKNRIGVTWAPSILLTSGQRKLRAGYRQQLYRDSIQIGIHLLRGISALHERLGSAHMDIKPSNIFAVKSGPELSVKIGDLEALSVIGDRVGGLTLIYKAPEQNISAVADLRSDLFSTALVLYQMTSGFDPAWRKGRPENYAARRAAISGLPPALTAVLVKALDPVPDRRYASAREMWQALERALPSVSGGPSKSWRERLELSVKLEFFDVWTWFSSQPVPFLETPQVGARLSADLGETEFPELLRTAFLDRNKSAQDRLNGRYGPETKGWVADVKFRKGDNAHSYVELFPYGRRRMAKVLLGDYGVERIRLHAGYDGQGRLWLYGSDTEDGEPVFQAYFDARRARFVHGREHFKLMFLDPEGVPELPLPLPIEETSTGSYRAFDVPEGTKYRPVVLPRREGEKSHSQTPFRISTAVNRNLSGIWITAKDKRVYGFLSTRDVDSAHAFAEWEWDAQARKFKNLRFLPPGSLAWFAAALSGTIEPHQGHYAVLKVGRRNVPLFDLLRFSIGFELLRSARAPMPETVTVALHPEEPGRLDVYHTEESDSMRGVLPSATHGGFIASKYYRAGSSNLDRYTHETARRFVQFLQDGKPALPIVFRSANLPERAVQIPVMRYRGKDVFAYLGRVRGYSGVLMAIRFTAIGSSESGERGLELWKLDEHFLPLKRVALGSENTQGEFRWHELGEAGGDWQSLRQELRAAGYGTARAASAVIDQFLAIPHTVVNPHAESFVVGPAGKNRVKIAGDSKVVYFGEELVGMRLFYWEKEGRLALADRTGMKVGYIRSDGSFVRLLEVRTTSNTGGGFLMRGRFFSFGRDYRHRDVVVVPFRDGDWDTGYRFFLEHAEGEDLIGYYDAARDIFVRTIHAQAVQRVGRDGAIHWNGEVVELDPSLEGQTVFLEPIAGHDLGALRTGFQVYDGRQVRARLELPHKLVHYSPTGARLADKRPSVLRLTPEEALEFGEAAVADGRFEDAAKATAAFLHSLDADNGTWSESDYRRVQSLILAIRKGGFHDFDLNWVLRRWMLDPSPSPVEALRRLGPARRMGLFEGASESDLRAIGAYGLPVPTESPAVKPPFVDSGMVMNVYRASDERVLKEVRPALGGVLPISHEFKLAIVGILRNGMRGMQDDGFPVAPVEDHPESPISLYQTWAGGVAVSDIIERFGSDSEEVVRADSSFAYWIHRAHRDYPGLTFDPGINNATFDWSGNLFYLFDPIVPVPEWVVREVRRRVALEELLEVVESTEVARMFGARLAVDPDIIEKLAKFDIEVKGEAPRFPKADPKHKWAMMDWRKPSRPGQGGPIVENPGDPSMPRAQLLATENLPLLAGGPMTSSYVYVTLMEAGDSEVPVLYKKFSSRMTPSGIESEILTIQILERLGRGPQFYGVVRDDSGKVIGYAMQIILGHTWAGNLGDHYMDLMMPLMSAGYTGVFKEGIVLENGKIVPIDMGDVYVANETDRKRFVATFNEGFLGAAQAAAGTRLPRAAHYAKYFSHFTEHDMHEFHIMFEEEFPVLAWRMKKFNTILEGVNLAASEVEAADVLFVAAKHMANMAGTSLAELRHWHEQKKHAASEDFYAVFLEHAIRPLQILMRYGVPNRTFELHKQYPLTVVENAAILHVSPRNTASTIEMREIRFFRDGSLTVVDVIKGGVDGSVQSTEQHSTSQSNKLFRMTFDSDELLRLNVLIAFQASQSPEAPFFQDIVAGVFSNLPSVKRRPASNPPAGARLSAVDFPMRQTIHWTHVPELNFVFRVTGDLLSPRSESTRLFLDHILANPADFKGKSTLDLGSGVGVLSAAFAKAGASEVTASDVRIEAKEETGYNLRRFVEANSLSIKNRALASDLYQDLQASGQPILFDVVASNHPYIADEQNPADVFSYAAHAGNNFSVIRGILRGMPSHLKPGGFGLVWTMDPSDPASPRGRFWTRGRLFREVRSLRGAAEMVDERKIGKFTARLYRIRFSGARLSVTQSEAQESTFWIESPAGLEGFDVRVNKFVWPTET